MLVSFHGLPVVTAGGASGAGARVVIVGGGFTGAAVAFHLAARAPGTTIRVVEPRSALGAGLAYSTRDPAHRINVPAARMSLVPDDGDHFARWLDASGILASDPEARLPDGRAFPRRAVFGRYVGEHLAGPLATGAVEHVRDAALSVGRTPDGFAVALASGRTIDADLVVVATSHPPPQVPDGLAAALAGHPGLIGDPWVDDMAEAVGPRERVLVVGTGLTMADVVASLDRRGHVGPITAVSRRGQRSQGHASAPVEPFGTFGAEPTAVALLAHLRRTLAEAAGRGLPWQSVLDALRAQGAAVWRAMPDEERRRLLRHLRPYWDTHRFRIAPQVEAVLRRREREGTLTIAAARVDAARPSGRAIAVSLRARGARRPVEALFDRVVVTTGPAHGRIFETSPFLGSLRDAGLATADPFGLGIAVDRESRPLDRLGRPVAGVLVAGPLARGTFGELMGLPEVAEHAVAVAGAAARQIGARPADVRSARADLAAG